MFYLHEKKKNNKPKILKKIMLTIFEGEKKDDSWQLFSMCV